MPSSFFIPLEQGLKPCCRVGCCRQTSSFFIPLEQGLKLLWRPLYQLVDKFFLHSIRTRIKTGQPYPKTNCMKVFFLHSIRTRIKTLVGRAAGLLVTFFLHSIRTRIKTTFTSVAAPLLCSFFIPLEQGLKRGEDNVLEDVVRFFLHSIRTRIKTND